MDSFGCLRSGFSGVAVPPLAAPAWRHGAPSPGTTACRGGGLMVFVNIYDNKNDLLKVRIQLVGWAGWPVGSRKQAGDAAKGKGWACNRCALVRSKDCSDCLKTRRMETNRHAMRRRKGPFVAGEKGKWLIMSVLRRWQKTACFGQEMICLKTMEPRECVCKVFSDINHPSAAAPTPAPDASNKVK